MPATKTRPATHRDAAAASAVINAARPARRGAKATEATPAPATTASAADAKAVAAAARAKKAAEAAAAKARLAEEAAAARAADEANTDNLRFVLVNGDFKVHVKGCPRLKVDLKASDYATPGSVQAGTELEAMKDLWSDIISDAPDDYATDEDIAGKLASATDFHKCVGLDLGYEVARPVTRRDAKQDLARRVALAIAACLAWMPDDAMAYTIEPAEREAITTAWVHHLPTGTDEEGHRWWPAEISRPDRSDWK